MALVDILKGVTTSKTVPQILKPVQEELVRLQRTNKRNTEKYEKLFDLYQKASQFVDLLKVDEKSSTGMITSCLREVKVAINNYLKVR